MLVSFDFAMLQLRYLEAAADKIPTFRPDGLDAAAFKNLIISARDDARTPYLNAKTDFDLARANTGKRSIWAMIR